MTLNPNLSFQNFMKAAIHAAEMEEAERRIADSSSANAEDIEELVKQLHQRIALTTAGSPLQDDLQKAADAIEGLNKRIDFLMNCIYEAEDSLDRGADNDWARTALEKAERGQDDV